LGVCLVLTLRIDQPFVKGGMINYNIMNIILDKKAFKEWEERMININDEYGELMIKDCKNKHCTGTRYLIGYNYDRGYAQYIHGIKPFRCYRCGLDNCQQYFYTVGYLSKNHW